tara:strand:- start:194 stop:799 length:606 start_codon:yes stop_codon:yes gene_type:complete
MSKENTVFAHKKTDASLGEGVGLSTSDTARLSKCYPDSPIHQATPKIKIDEKSKDFTAEGSSLEYKQLYFDACMRGKSQSSDLGDQDMSYGTSKILGYTSVPPDYEYGAPEGELAAPGSAGSTISASRLGPNVSINPAYMADVKPNASQPSPMASATKMSPSDTESIPRKFDLGKSLANDVASTIGTINDGQSVPVDPGES